VEALAPFTDVLVKNAAFLVPAMAIFARLSALLFLLPGIGEKVISVRIRLTVALCLSFILIPLITANLGPTEYNISEAGVLIISETVYGLLLGLALRLMIFTLQILGNIVSQALSISQVLGEGIATEPNTTISTLFMMAGAALLVTQDLHVEVVGVFYRSFEIMPLGTFMDFDSAAFWLVNKTVEAFALGVSLALPFIILNFVYNLIIGFLNRAMPQLMVSFVGMPAITGVGIFLMVVSSGSILTIWAASYYEILQGLEGIVS